MATYAEFETTEELHRRPYATIWKARGRRGGEGESFAVKVCRPAEWLDEGGDPVGAMAEFAAVPADLKAMQGNQYWVPVIASGVDKEEAFWVTKLYPRSLQTILERGALLPPEDVHWVASAVARALGELSKVLRRPHGNLKPSNIFIDGEGRLHGLGILLSDLKPKDRLNGEEDQIADFRELGRLIVLIVRRRPADTRKAIGWPIEDGVEWKRFGRQGKAWREFCNRLLNPQPDRADLDWSAVGKRLVELTPVKARRWPFFLLGGVATVVVVGGISYVRFRNYDDLSESLQPWALRIGNKPPDTKDVVPEWAILCRGYKSWLGGLIEVSKTKHAEAAKAWPPYIKEQVLGELTKLQEEYRGGLDPSRGILDPRSLVRLDLSKPDGILDDDLQTLAAEPPAIVKKGEIRVRIQKVGRAMQRAAQALETWPSRRTLEETERKFTELKWTNAASDLARAIKQSTPSKEENAPGQDISGGIVAVLATADAAAKADKLWREAEQRAQQLANAGDPVMKNLPGYMQGQVSTAPDLDGTVAALLGLERETKEWLNLVQGPDGKEKIDRAQFARSSALSVLQVGITPEVIKQWKADLSNFQILAKEENPRLKPNWRALLSKVDASIADLRKEEGNSPPANGVLASAGFQEERTKANALVDSWSNLRLIRKDLQIAESDASRVTAEIEALNERVRAAIGLLQINPQGWLDEVRGAVVGAAGSTLRREWDRRRDQFLAGLDATALLRNAAEFRGLRERERALRAFFTELAGPRGVARFPTLDTSAMASDLRPALDGWARTRLERATTEWLGKVNWDGTVPSGTAEAFIASPAARDVIDRLSADWREATEMGADFSVVNGRLAQGYGLEDPAVGSLSKWTKRPIFAEVGTGGAFRALSEIGATLDSLRREENRETLVAASGAPLLGVALTAWRRLAELPTWPTVTELDTEARIADVLAQRVDSAVTEPARKEALRKERTTEEIRRWRVALRSAPDDVVLGQVLEKRAAFGLGPTDLAPTEKFNVELKRLKQIDWRSLPEERVVAQRDEAVNSLRSPLGGQASPSVAQWLDALLKLVLTDQGVGQSDVRKMGPGAMGWEGTTSAGGQYVEYKRRGGEQRLGFTFIGVEGAPPFFLCTTEFSVGVLMDLMADKALRPKLQPWMTKVVGSPRNGPQMWVLDSDNLVRLNSQWTGERKPGWPPENALYSPKIKDPGSPTANAPLQYIPPEAALSLARDVMGCRLMQPDEWRALVKSGLTEKSADPLVGPNLRDLTWEAEQKYFFSDGKGLIHVPLDADIFWPAEFKDRKKTASGLAATIKEGSRDDGVLWFAPAKSDEAQPERVRNLIGNVAEYLYDEVAKAFYVAGGSALSPPEVVPEKIYPVESLDSKLGYSDVGLRLAFDAPGSVVGRWRLQQLISNQPFLRP